MMEPMDRFARDFASELRTQVLGRALTLLETTDSTNRVLREKAEPTHGETVAALTQSGGRGRAGHRFASPPGGLYMSVFTADAQPTPAQHTLTAAVALRRALLPWAACEIKWVNDLLWQSRKVCGILCERVPSGVVCGVGCNLGDSLDLTQHPELRALAGCLPGTLRPGVLAARFLNALEAARAEPFADVVAEYRTYCCSVGAFARPSPDAPRRLLRGIADDGTPRWGETEENA